MRTVYNIPKTAVTIYGDHSSMPVYAYTEVVEALGGVELAFHEIKRLQGRNMLPRMGSQSRPLKMRDITYARENEQRGEKYWQWLQFTGVREQTGYDYVYGYGHKTDTGYVIVNADGSTFEEIVM